MMDDKSHSERDRELTDALKGTFPGSDPLASQQAEHEPLRPLDRSPVPVDRALIEELARQAEAKKTG